MELNTNVLLVHGAWADGSSWSKVISLLQKKGIDVKAVQLPLISLDEDIAVERNILTAQKGPGSRRSLKLCSRLPNGTRPENGLPESWKEHA
jgi:hypothetical protein